MPRTDVCRQCGAVSHGNLTCPTCRAHMREATPHLKDILDRIDEMDPPTVPPLTAEDVQGFIDRLDAYDPHA